MECESNKPQPEGTAATRPEAEWAVELRQYELLVEALQWLPVVTVVNFCDRDDFIEEVRRDGWRPRRECKDHEFIGGDGCAHCGWEPGEPVHLDGPPLSDLVAAAALPAPPKEPAGGQWVSVAERLPGLAGMYLCFHPEHGQDVIFWTGKSWGKTSFWNHEDGTHWMQLPTDPPPPSQEQPK